MSFRPPDPVPLDNCASIFVAPGKSPARAPPLRRTFWMAQLRPASTGVVVVSMSLPYRHKPASSRKELRAPRPAGRTSGWAIQKVRRSGGARAGGFPGATKILAQLSGGTAAGGRKLVGLRALERIPVREHSVLQATDGQALGEVTSGLLSPSLDVPIALGYVPPEFSAPGTRLQALVRGKPVPMEVVALPFVPHRYVRA